MLKFILHLVLSGRNVSSCVSFLKCFLTAILYVTFPRVKREVLVSIIITDFHCNILQTSIELKVRKVDAKPNFDKLLQLTMYKGTKDRVFEYYSLIIYNIIYL